jgi:hypothetical protein
MKKLSLALLASFISLSVNAASTSNLSDTLNKSLQKQSKNTNSSTIVYGGKDISRSIVASTHEFSWTKQQVLVG